LVAGGGKKKSKVFIASKKGKPPYSVVRENRRKTPRSRTGRQGESQNSIEGLARVM